jgi:hypothetical protein
MESILNDIVTMGIEEGPVLFQMTAKLIVKALRSGFAAHVGNIFSGEVLSCHLMG